MTQKMQRQRGEGKVGCIISLIVLLIAGAIAFKILPVYISNNQLVDFADDLGTRAGLTAVPALEKQLKQKAGELEIPEARAAGAMTIAKSGTMEGTCTIRLRYTRNVDLYGITTIPITVDKNLAKPYMNAM